MDTNLSRRVWIVAVVVLCIQYLNVQVLSGQCVDGNQPECMCSTAPVLCTIDELDGYMFSMTDYQHEDDAPSPLCPPPEGAGTIPNNPTWFAFIAWCTSLTLEVHVTNCQPHQGGVIGVQIAIYSNCTTYTNVACDANASDCDETDRTISMNNLIIGNTYYFMIDGCLGSYCDVTVDVVGVCGEEMIEDWSEPIDGPTEICAGDSEVHLAEDLDGATDYHWYIDGVLIMEGANLTAFSHVWDSAGTFELCVDASNDPCIPESDPPEPNCISITVFDADAGMITATPTPVCPNDVVMITASGFNSDAGYHQYIVIADASGIIVDVVSGSSTSFTHDECATFTAYSYNYHDAGGNDIPQVGDPVSTITCSDGCCDTDMAPFEFVDSEDPVLINPPADIMLTCYDLLPPMADLNWTDNCTGTSSVAGTETGVADGCDGGILMREWEYTDDCGNTAMYQQMITIDPTPPPEFVSPPADVTVDCSNIPVSAPALVAMNTGTGACGVMELVTPVQNGAADECGGTFSFTWDFTDVCNHTITHTQTITVTPIAAPVFDIIVQDITLGCSEIPTGVPDLTYSNGGTGPCAIEGSVPADISGSADLCGGMIRYEWDFTDQCGRSISAIQNITVNPVAEAMYLNPPADLTVACDAIPTSPSLDYTNGETGDCLIGGTIVPSIDNNATSCGGTITNTWQTTDPCDRTIEHVQVVTVMPAPGPAWINPPADTMIDCGMLPTQIPDLAFSNGQSGICEIAGSVPGVQITYDLCQGLIVWQWTFTDLCGNTITHTQNITTVPPPPVVFVGTPADTTVNCDAVPGSIPPLSYTNNGSGPCLVSGAVNGVQTGSYNVCGGVLNRNWTVTDPCGAVYTAEQTITVLPAPPIMWVNPPPDATLSCDQVPGAPPVLTASNGISSGPCSQVAQVSAQVSGSYSACGGDLIYTWTYTDPCSNTISHSQDVHVLAAPVPTIDTSALPALSVLSCQEVANVPLELPYSNGGIGTCAIIGVATGMISEPLDPCGGDYTFEWTATDPCGNVLTHTRTISALPAPTPQWVNPPQDDTLGCDDDYLPPEDLLFSNNQLGDLTVPCALEVSIVPEVEYLNNVYTHTWTYQWCNEVFEYVQHVMISPEPEVNLDPANATICSGESFDLATVTVVEINGYPVFVSYHSGSPATSGNELSSSVVSPAVDVAYVFLVTNDFDCSAEVDFEIFVDPLPNAGDDAMQAICSTEGVIDFTDYLSFDADQGGYWIDVDQSGVLLDNPSSVSFAFVDPGTYHFQYVVAINDCPADTSVLTIILSGGPDYVIDSVYCANANTTYTVVLLGENLVLAPNFGDVVTIPGGLMIENIPIDEELSFDIWDADLFCVVSNLVSAPNCDCPQVPPPVDLGDVQICVGDPNPALAVSVPPGTTAHWYSVPVGGVALAMNTTMYTPTQTLPGTYIFYVETESIEYVGCLSNTRIQIVFEISTLPVVNDLALAFCDSLETGTLNIDLSNWKPQINGNPLNTFTFHSSSGDAEAGINPLSMPVLVPIGSTDFFARVVNAKGCVAVAWVAVTLHALPPVVLNIEHEQCLGDSNGIISLAGLDMGQSYTMVLDGVTYTDQFQFTGLNPGPHTLNVTSAGTGCDKNLQFFIDAGIQLTISNVTLTCNDNGTDTDPSDDYYTIDVVVATTGGTMIYNLMTDGISQGLYSYGQTASFTAPALNQSVTIQVIDTTHGCNTTVTTASLSPCSSNCDITIDTHTLECNDNGTPLVPEDDYYNIMWNASVVFGSTSGLYDILVDGVSVGSGTYDADEGLTLPADGGAHSIELQDFDDPNCTIQLNFPALTTCSDACALTANNLEIYCDNNGTNQTETDDIYYVVVQVDGVNILSNTWSVAGQATTGILGARDTLGPYLVTGGNQQIIFNAVGGNCTDTIQAAAPPACSACDQTIDAGPDMVLDCGTPTVLLAVTSSSPGIASWTDPGGGTTQSETINVSLAGQYIATVVFPDGCVFSDTVIVSSDPTLPAVWGGPDQKLNCDIREVLLESQILVGSGAIIYEWTDNSGNVIATTSTVLITGPGIYYVRIYDPTVDCWSGKDEVVVQDISNQPSAIIYANPGNIISCVIEFVILSNDQEANVLYNWISQGQIYTDTELAVYESGVVTLVALDTITLCESRDSILVQEFIDYPSILVDPPLPLTCARTSVTIDASGSIPSSGVDYIWTNLAGDTLGTNHMLNVQNAGAYIIELIDPMNGCFSVDTVMVVDISELPEIIDAADIVIPCDNNSGMLNVSLVIPLPGLEILWITAGGQIVGSATGSQITFNGAGTYIVEVTHALSQCKDADTIVVSEIADRPQGLQAEVSAANCEDVSDGMITFNGVQGGTPPYTYYVNGVQISGTILTDLSAGTYLIQIEDANGCALDTVLTILTGEEVLVDLETKVTIRLGEDHLLMAGVNIPASEISSVLWTPGDYLSCDTCLVTQAVPLEDITYTVLVTDIYGCTGEATVAIKVIDETQIFVPNVISPSNGDQINDFFTVFSNKTETRILTMRIFDRWGEVLFEKKDFLPNIPSEGWNGTFKGQPVNPAVFVYMVEVEIKPGIIEILKGDVTVIR